VACIAVIGGDGAGKTTITRRLLAAGRLPFRYLYMGINVESSNVALPTTRLLQRLRHGRSRPATTHASGPPRPKPRGAKGALRSAARLLYRLSEEWYRQALCWLAELRGEIVLCDRHFLYDFYEPAARRAAKARADRIHLWLLERAYPRPDLVLFLDAPAEVLMARKGEASLEFLGGRRAAMLEIGANDPRFARIDATQPLDAVYAEVEARIDAFLANRGRSRRPGVRPRPRGESEDVNI
jgi:thymidylate kinase